MYNVYDNDTGDLIGALDYFQLQWLRSRLEEESMEDKDYAISSLEISLFESVNSLSNLFHFLLPIIYNPREVSRHPTSHEFLYPQANYSPNNLFHFLIPILSSRGRFHAIPTSHRRFLVKFIWISYVHFTFFLTLWAILITKKWTNHIY